MIIECIFNLDENETSLRTTTIINREWLFVIVICHTRSIYAVFVFVFVFI